VDCFLVAKAAAAAANSLIPSAVALRDCSAISSAVMRFVKTRWSVIYNFFGYKSGF
jgi:hypothetical protein